MGQNKSESPAGFIKQSLSWFYNTQINATANPLIKFTTPVGFTPLALRVCFTADRTTGDETYVVSMEDDTVAISTANDAVAGATGYKVIEATFALSTHVAKDSVVEIIFTLGGTSPLMDATVIELDYIED